MVKNKSSFTANILKITGFFFRILETAAFLGIIGAGFFVWYNPQAVYSKFGHLLPTVRVQSDTTALDDLTEKVEKITQTMQNDAQKTDLIISQFTYFDKSKADAGEIISINNKLDTLRNLTEKLTKTSNSGALILTSAMLIRDNATRGITCEKEAEALKILTEGINGFNDDIAFITAHCGHRFLSAAEIVKNFNYAYTSVKKEYEPKNEKDWKQRLTSKINEYVKISKPDETPAEPQFNTLAVLTEIKKLVDAGDFAGAAAELDKQENATLIENYPYVKEWYDNTRSQLEFYKILSNIISNSLLIMKVEDARNIAE